MSAVTVRIPFVDEAIFDVLVFGDEWRADFTVYHGPQAHSAPPKANPLAGRIDPFTLASNAIGEERTGSIYVPPGIADGVMLPVIYLADGNISGFAPILEAAIHEQRAAPAIIVGIDPARGHVENCQSPCDRRALEYLIDINVNGELRDTAFGRHLHFVTDELIPYIEKNYPAAPMRDQRITAGYSNGGAWALAAAQTRPDLFGKVLAMSSGSKIAAESADRLRNSRLYAGAGKFEPGFLRRTHQAANVARAAGAEVRFREIVAGHSMPLWEILFSDGIEWLLPPEQPHGFPHRVILCDAKLSKDRH